VDKRTFARRVIVIIIFRRVHRNIINNYGDLVILPRPSNRRDAVLSLPKHRNTSFRRNKMFLCDRLGPWTGCAHQNLPLLQKFNRRRADEARRALG
jgi:hypothetical protein